MKYKKVIGLVVAIACALASLWIGTWLACSVFSNDDWQQVPAILTASIFGSAALMVSVKLFAKVTEL